MRGARSRASRSPLFRRRPLAIVRSLRWREGVCPNGIPIAVARDVFRTRRRRTRRRTTKEEAMAMREYDRDRDYRGMNGLFGRDQQWQEDSAPDWMRNERGGEWSTRPRYGQGESD